MQQLPAQELCLSRYASHTGMCPSTRCRSSQAQQHVASVPAASKPLPLRSSPHNMHLQVDPVAHLSLPVLHSSPNSALKLLSQPHLPRTAFSTHLCLRAAIHALLWRLWATEPWTSLQVLQEDGGPPAGVARHSMEHSVTWGQPPPQPGGFASHLLIPLTRVPCRQGRQTEAPGKCHTCTQSSMTAFAADKAGCTPLY